MRINGDVVAGPASWAGVMFSPGNAQMQPVNLSARKAVTLKVRGTPGEYVLVMLHGQSQVAAVPIDVGDEWREIRVPLAKLEGADLTRVMSFGVTNSRAGHFQVDIDDVAIE